MSDILPQHEKTTRTSVKLSDALWKELEEIARTTDYSRDEVMSHFLKWAVQEWRAERSPDKKPKR